MEKAGRKLLERKDTAPEYKGNFCVRAKYVKIHKSMQCNHKINLNEVNINVQLN